MKTNEEFKKLFLAAATDLAKIQLAIRERRYTIWNRSDKPNLSGNALLPILALKENHPVKKVPRKSGGRGASHVLEVKYSYMGVAIYMKGYFQSNDTLWICFSVQSLRANEE